MMDSNIHFSMNSFDSIVLGILALSSIIAFFRGFLKELLSFIAWVGAAAFTLYFFPHADDIMRDYIHENKVAAGAAALATYFTALVMISLVNATILKYAKEGMEVGLLDNFLGLMFGALRGAFILSFGYLIMMAIVPKSPEPQFLKGSITKEYLKEGADILVSVAPKYMVDMEAIVKTQVDHQNNPQSYAAPDSSRDKSPQIDNSIR